MRFFGKIRPDSSWTTLALRDDQKSKLNWTRRKSFPCQRKRGTKQENVIKGLTSLQAKRTDRERERETFIGGFLLQNFWTIEGPKDHNPDQNINSSRAARFPDCWKKTFIHRGGSRWAKRDLTENRPWGSMDHDLKPLELITFSVERRDKRDWNSAISSSFKFLLKANDQDEVSWSQCATTEPEGKRAILWSLENCSLMACYPPKNLTKNQF